MSLKRIPQRSSTKAKKPPKLPALKGKLVAAAKLLELSSGKVMYPMPFIPRKEGRKTTKLVTRTSIALAAQALLQPTDTIIAFLEKKKFEVLPPDGAS